MEKKRAPRSSRAAVLRSARRIAPNAPNSRRRRPLLILPRRKRTRSKKQMRFGGCHPEPPRPSSATRRSGVKAVLSASATKSGCQVARHLIHHRPCSGAPLFAHQQPGRGEVDGYVARGERVERFDGVADLVDGRRGVLVHFDRAVYVRDFPVIEERREQRVLLVRVVVHEGGVERLLELRGG